MYNSTCWYWSHLDHWNCFCLSGAICPLADCLLSLPFPLTSEKTYREVSYQLVHIWTHINSMTIFYSRHFWEIHQDVKCAMMNIERSLPQLCHALTYSWASSTKSSWHLYPPLSKEISLSLISGRQRVDSCRYILSESGCVCFIQCRTINLLLFLQ